MNYPFKDAHFELPFFFYYSYLSVAMARLRLVLVEDAVSFDLAVHGDELHKTVARPEGLEPPAFWFVARRSIQLSYGRAGQKQCSTS